MKRIILTLIVIATATLSLYGREVAKNPATGLTLSEIAGQYTLTGKSGAIILGNIDHAKQFLLTANKAIVKEALNDIFDCDKDQLEVGKDDQGYYVIKVGLGGAKIRLSDTLVFGGALGLKDLEEPAKKVWSKTQDVVGKLIDKM